MGIKIGDMVYVVVAVYANGYTLYNTDVNGKTMFDDRLDYCDKEKFVCYVAYIDGDRTSYHGKTIGELIKNIKEGQND